MIRQILLVRHGRTTCDEQTPIRGTDFDAWVRAYDAAPIDPSLAPPAALCARAAVLDLLVTSTLRRSLESAALLIGGRRALSSPLFDEAELPTAIPFRFRLPPSYWDAAARGAWLCGWSAGVESVREARARAARAADSLAALAYDHGSVVLVGHGQLNRMIAGALRRLGWKGPTPGHEFWTSAVLTAGSTPPSPSDGPTDGA